MSVPPVKYDDLHESWRRWLTEIDPHITDLFHNRAIWRAVREALDTRVSDDTFLRSFTKIYVDATSVGVRRLADPNATKATRSLARLMKAIRSQPEVVARDRWVSMCTADRKDDRPWAKESWRELIVRDYDGCFGNDAGALRLPMVDEDLALLAERSRKVSDFADRVVAHIDGRGLDELPTFDDLDAAIDCLGEMYQRYLLLVTGETRLNVAPVIQGDWQAPLRTPLFQLPPNSR